MLPRPFFLKGCRLIRTIDLFSLLLIFTFFHIPPTKCTNICLIKKKKKIGISSFFIANNLSIYSYRNQCNISFIPYCNKIFPPLGLFSFRTNKPNISLFSPKSYLPYVLFLIAETLFTLRYQFIVEDIHISF